MKEISAQLRELREAREIAAEVVVRCGERFLPVFQRIDEDYELLQKKQAALDRARRLVANDNEPKTRSF